MAWWPHPQIASAVLVLLPLSLLMLRNQNPLTSKADLTFSCVIDRFCVRTYLVNTLRLVAEAYAKVGIASTLLCNVASVNAADSASCIS
jgi:hypothetical protein